MIIDWTAGVVSRSIAVGSFSLHGEIFMKCIDLNHDVLKFVQRIFGLVVIESSG